MNKHHNPQKIKRATSFYDFSEEEVIEAIFVWLASKGEEPSRGEIKLYPQNQSLPCPDDERFMRMIIVEDAKGRIDVEPNRIKTDC